MAKCNRKHVKMTKAEIVDRYTILRLKSEHGLDVKKELRALSDEVDNVPDTFIERLYSVNAQMWEIEDMAELGGEGLEDMGRLFHKQRELNKTRVKIKNEIARHFKEVEEQKLFV